MEYFNAHSHMTRHALRRLQQRGIPSEAVQLIDEHGDIELNAGRGCISMQISRRKTASLMADGYAPGLVERAANLVVIRCEETGHIVTVLHVHGQRARRRRPRHSPGRLNRWRQRHRRLWQ
ncbi:MAG: hypothetical protein ACE5H8_00205 [Alphaproteobacteria bacterium]